MPDYTGWLNAASGSNRDDLFAELYRELKRIAAARIACERGGRTLNATALVHEAWLRLEKSAPEHWRDRKQFYAAASEAMRRILVEAARRRIAAKRGGGEADVPLDGVEVAATLPDERLLGIHEALDRLDAEDELHDAAPWVARLREAGVKARAIERLEDGTWRLDLRGSTISDLAPLKGQNISFLHLEGTSVSDLTPLREMPLKTLALGGTKVTDLAPLRGMPLKTLQLYGLNITDLSPLSGLPLEDLWMGYYTGDLSVLKGMPLRLLKLHDCAATTDFSPLAESNELTSLTLPRRRDEPRFPPRLSQARAHRLPRGLEPRRTGGPDARGVLEGLRRQ